MIGVLILLMFGLLTYIFLRSHGGEGLNIKAQFAPASTPEGRRDRIITALLLAAMITSLLIVYGQRDGDKRLFEVVIPVVVGALVVLVPYINKKNRK